MTKNNCGYAKHIIIIIINFELTVCGRIFRNSSGVEYPELLLYTRGGHHFLVPPLVMRMLSYGPGSNIILIFHF